MKYILVSCVNFIEPPWLWNQTYTLGHTFMENLLHFCFPLIYKCGKNRTLQVHQVLCCLKSSKDPVPNHLQKPLITSFCYTDAIIYQKISLIIQNDPSVSKRKWIIHFRFQRTLMNRSNLLASVMQWIPFLKALQAYCHVAKIWMLTKFEVKHGNNAQLRGITPQCEAVDTVHFKRWMWLCNMMSQSWNGVDFSQSMPYILKLMNA